MPHPGEENIDTRRGEAYQKFMVPAVFEPWGRDLVARAAPKRGDRVLDLACGTGVVTRLAAERVAPSGTVTGLDVDPGYLKVARSIPPPDGTQIEWREGSAHEIPFGEDSFDLGLCQQGLQFFPDRPAALREMRRVIRPGGKVVVSVWRKVEYCPGFHALSAALERHGGPLESKPATFALGDGEELAELARGAGFRDVTIDAVSIPARFESPERFAEIVAAAGPALGRALARMDEEARGAMLEDVRSTLGKYTDGDGVEFPFESHIMIGYV